MLVSSSPVARHGLVAKVADLGLSRILKQQASHRTTRTVRSAGRLPECSATLSFHAALIWPRVEELGLQPELMTLHGMSAADRRAACFPAQVGMLTHQPPELLRDGRMSPAVDIYRCGLWMLDGQHADKAACSHSHVV